MKSLEFVVRMVLAPFIGCVIALMAWYLWTQEEMLAAKTKYDA